MKSKTINLLYVAMVILLIVTTKSYALNYTISFTASGATTTVGSVEVKNLTKGTTVTVPNGNTLTLSDVTTDIDLQSVEDRTMQIMQNASTGVSTIKFYATQSGSTQVSAFAIDGRKIGGQNFTIEEGVNALEISLPKGVFVVRVTGQGYGYTSKLFNPVSTNSIAKIKFLSNSKIDGSKILRSKTIPIQTTTMTYTSGDQLLYKAVSGNYSNIVTDKPTGSKTTNFEFVACTDADGNNYATVKIGTQTWMAENLKTTRFRNGQTLTDSYNSNGWINGGWSDYENIATNGIKYGKLYNWYTASDSRSIAPLGWHVSTYDEWTILSDFLGGQSIAGDKLKESGTDNWPSPNTGTNATGFTALPCGTYFNGSFSSLGLYSYWWTSSGYGSVYAWNKDMSYNGSHLTGSNGSGRETGFSVRCVKNDVPTISSTYAASAITTTTSTSGGEVTFDGGAMIIARGICWSTSTAPTTILSTKTTESGTSGAYSSTMTGLIPNTTYYVRAYATNSVGTAYGDEISFTTSTLAIGDLYLGGKVAYIDESGIHGFVCALEDQSTSIYWGAASITTIGAAYTELETNGVYGISKSGGRKNTDVIIAAQGIYPCAASICAALTIGGALPGEWYLPSKGELYQVYINRAIIGGFSLTNYWSSSEFDTNYAWLQRFLNGIQSNSGSKGGGLRVRAIRAF